MLSVIFLVCIANPFGSGTQSIKLTCPQHVNVTPTWPWWVWTCSLQLTWFVARPKSTRQLRCLCNPIITFYHSRRVAFRHIFMHFFCIFFCFLHKFLKIRCDITFSAPPPPPIFHSIITLRANYLPPYGWVIWYLNAPCTDIFNSMNKDREPYWKYAIYLWVYHCVLTIHIVQLFRFNEVSFLCNWSFRSLSGAQLCCSIT